MKLVKLDQPENYQFRGKTIYVNPEDVMRVSAGETYNESLVKLRTGEAFTVKGEPGDIARLLERASQ